MQASALSNEAFSLFNAMSAAKQRTLIQFARFLNQQPEEKAETADATSTPPSANLLEFGSLRGKIHYIAPDFDEPIEDFAEYM